MTRDAPEDIPKWGYHPLDRGAPSGTKTGSSWHLPTGVLSRGDIRELAVLEALEVPNWIAFTLELELPLETNTNPKAAESGRIELTA